MSASLVFEQSYGEVKGDSASLAELCAMLSSLGNIPLLGRRGQARPQVHSAVTARFLSVGQGPVSVVYEGTQASERALVMAREIAHAEGSKLVVLLVAGEAEAKELRTRAAQGLGKLASSARYVAILSTEPTHLAQAVGREGCTLLILPRESLSPEAANALLEGIACPLALVP